MDTDVWQEAVLNECMAIEGCYVEADPVKTVRCLIDWHVKNATEPPAQDKDDAYKAAWVEGFESAFGRRQAEIDMLRSELLREKEIKLVHGPRPSATVYTDQGFVERGCTTKSVDDHKTANVSDKAPAQEDEPCGYISLTGVFWPLSSCAHLEDAHKASLIPIYTRPQNDKLTTRVPYREAFQRGAASCDKLRKTAEDVLRVFDSYMLQESRLPILIGSIENLRAALEDK